MIITLFKTMQHNIIKLLKSVTSHWFRYANIWTKFHNRKLHVEYLWLNFTQHNNTSNNCRRKLNSKYGKTVFSGSTAQFNYTFFKPAHHGRLCECICYLRAVLFLVVTMFGCTNATVCSIEYVKIFLSVAFSIFIFGVTNKLLHK